MVIQRFDADSENLKYGVIYSDPPWPQGRGRKKLARPNSSGMELPYPTMTLLDIQAFHNSVLTFNTQEKHNMFMWAIEKFLPEIETMMGLLGYKVHARIIWDKGNGPSAAYTLRFSHEYLIWFFKPGQILLPVKGMRGQYSTIIRENSRKHSQKPEAAYRLLEDLFPDAEKLELFARETRKGWDSYGIDVGSDPYLSRARVKIRAKKRQGVQ